ncbi:MAG: response regulator [Cytophagaceae bacterium]
MKKLSKILLVDDDNINNYINKHLILKAGFAQEVNIVLNGEEALNYLKSQDAEGHEMPELLLLDINMPVMDGFEFLEAFTKQTIKGSENIKIVMLTTSTNPNDTGKIKDTLIVKDYINKPLTEGKLNDIVQKHFS